MRLWHYKLIPFLPKQQLLAQWRELNSIFVKQDKHILINYVYEYPKDDLNLYANFILMEMVDRDIKVKSLANYNNYFGKPKLLSSGTPFKNHHNNRYLLQCFYNLQEKYDKGQKDFSSKQYEALEQFVRKELNL